MKQVGIWLDKQEARGVVLQNGTESFFSIPSELDFYKPKGGSRSKTPWGPQQEVHDSKYLEREKHQLKKYFEKIAQEAQDADQLAIFGPGETPEKFAGSLEENHPGLAAKIMVKEKTDNMTDNQLKALVKKSFGMDDRYPEN